MATESSKGPHRRIARIIGGAVLIFSMGIGVALAALPPGGTFIDDDGHIFEGAIEAIAAEGITKGCTNDKFCPNDKVTRGEMAVFLVRAMGYMDNGGGNLFTDDDGLFYENAADKLFTAGVTQGCNPPINDRYCGSRNVTRGEMAAFLVRAMGYIDNGGGNLFIDDDGHLFENAIDKLGTAGVTKGCNPPVNDKFCPNDFVTRGQMAAFLSRALGLSPIVPPPREPPIDGMTITGTVCPCTVTGTATLQGNVSLEGDLIVDGGTLIARPGVDLKGNGHQIMFVNGGRADFQGTPVFTWSNNGSNANLERDINFRNLRRIMFQDGAGPSILKFFTVSDSGTATPGDFPLHWHLNGDSTRGTIVEGVVVVNGANHAFWPHGSHGITFKDTIAKNIVGDAYGWDAPGANETCSFQKFCTRDNSNDITYDHALAYDVDNGNGSRGFRLTGFLLGAGNGNVIRNSVATNVSPGHIKDCSGFHWPEGANGNTGGNVWEFINNRSSSSSGCHGIFVWQNDGNPHVIDGFTGGGIDHGAYGNRYVYKNIDVPYFEVHAVGVRITSGRIDTVFTRSVRIDSVPTAVFENVSINRFVIQNGNRELPGHYVLNNTGLGCDDIEYENVATGTTVIIDGEECES